MLYPQVLCANCHIRKTRLSDEYGKVSRSVEMREKRRAPGHASREKPPPLLQAMLSKGDG